MAYTADEVLGMLDSSGESDLRKIQVSYYLMGQNLKVKSLINLSLPHQFPIPKVLLQISIQHFLDYFKRINSN